MMGPLLLVLIMGMTAASCALPGVRDQANSAVLERLMFGRNADGRQVVSDSAWSAFLAEYVTPRFPDGFTVLQATGQWKRADGEIEQEGSYILEVVHPHSSAADSSIRSIISEYKRRFRQESVLRTIVPVHMSY